MEQAVKPNACIISFYMKNLDIKTVQKQRDVVAKFNKSKHTHYSVLTDISHGQSMDLMWQFNGIDHPTFANVEIPKRFDHDIILFLDVDAIPLNDQAIDYYISEAEAGRLIGNIQRSNHIENDQHVFAAPSAVALSVDTFLTLKKPSAVPTYRADVGEEYTFAAEKVGIPVDFMMPLRFDEAPAECPSWALKDGMPVYGRGTTFGDSKERELFWHNFQSFHPGQQEKFMKKCEEVLNG